jgi:hypothetical protein
MIYREHSLFPPGLLVKKVCSGLRAWNTTCQAEISNVGELKLKLKLNEWPTAFQSRKTFMDSELNSTTSDVQHQKISVRSRAIAKGKCCFWPIVDGFSFFILDTSHSIIEAPNGDAQE